MGCLVDGTHPPGGSINTPLVVKHVLAIVIMSLFEGVGKKLHVVVICFG